MTVGVLGGGQLARMLALAGYPLGLRFKFLDRAADACAFPLGEGHVGGFDDRRCLDALIDGADCVTYEFENVDVRGAKYVAERVPVHPPVDALATKQDRLIEKRLFRQLEIPTSPFCNLETEADLDRVKEVVGLPLVLKSRSLGYDGKGQLVVNRAADLLDSWERLGRVPVIAEQFIQFDREISMIAARSPGGQTAFYPLSENVHEEAILRVATCRDGDPMTSVVQQYVERLLEHFEYVGVLALELFQRGEALFANEYAPRVHNTGHWTIEGAETSQFENHLRAILGLPLGVTAAMGAAAMVNCIGNTPELTAMAGIPGVHPHIYDKAARPRRKIGHITVRAPSDELLQQSLAKLRGRYCV